MKVSELFKVSLMEDGTTIKQKTIKVDGQTIVLRLWDRKSSSFIGAYLEKDGEPVRGKDGRYVSVEKETIASLKKFDAMVDKISKLKFGDDHEMLKDKLDEILS